MPNQVNKKVKVSKKKVGLSDAESAIRAAPLYGKYAIANAKMK